jgi:hypothetical protein
MTQYRYLIGYVISGGGRFGNVDLTRHLPIVSRSHVDGIQRDLQAHFGTPDLMVLSFSRYTDVAAGEQS